MGFTDRPLSSSPWTVVLQGTRLKYEDATLLDKLEYALRIGAPSVERHLSQPDVINNLASALSDTVASISNDDSLIRAGKLFNAIVEFIVAPNHESFCTKFLDGLSAKLFAPFITVLKNEKEVSSWYAGALGRILGQKCVVTFAATAGTSDLLEEHRVKYVTYLSSTLALITKDCVIANMEGDEEDQKDNLKPAAPASSLASSVPISETPASSLGYIPTVAGITAGMPTPSYVTSGDEQLGRILSGLAVFLSVDENRFLFCKTRSATADGAPGPTVLAGLLDKDVGLPVQVYYQTVFCLWLLSFASQQSTSSVITECVSKALEEAAVPRRLTAVLREVWAEKVVRISLATLRNIMQMSMTLRKEMIGAGLVGALQSLCFRRWNDEDIRDDLGVLAEALESELASMSNFDVYRAEVLSGALEWTPAHRDEMFWRENVEKLDRNQQEVLRCMVRLLHESTNDIVLAVACNDLAQFIKFHPRGRAIAQSLGVKARLMELMISGEGDVRRYALNCVQVLMIRWNRHDS